MKIALIGPGIMSIPPSGWGGVEALIWNHYNELIKRGINGVSSWSKALVLHDCNKYAIFDARVSSSLNYLQVINNTKEKILFPRWLGYVPPTDSADLQSVPTK